MTLAMILSFPVAVRVITLTIACVVVASAMICAMISTFGYACSGGGGGGGQVVVVVSMITAILHSVCVCRWWWW